jgi:hypothetical protein
VSFVSVHGCGDHHIATPIAAMTSAAVSQGTGSRRIGRRSVVRAGERQRRPDVGVGRHAPDAFRERAGA